MAQGDDWSSLVVPTILSSDVYHDGRATVFIVWDERAHAGAMPFVAIAPTIASGTVAEVQLDHASLFAFAEDALGISTRLRTAATAPDLRATLRLCLGVSPATSVAAQKC